MCKICEEWRSKKLNAKELFTKIKTEMDAIKEKGVSGNQEKWFHLMDLSEKILDQEIPFTESDPDSESYVDGNTDWSS